MKWQLSILSICSVLLFSNTGCKKYLDINSNEATPQNPDVSSVFPTQLSNIPRGLQYDGRYISKYVQNFATASVGSTAALGWDQMGYQANSDNCGDIWRMTYYGLGKNLNYIIEKGTKNAQWDYVGAALALKAMSFQYTTDLHGDIIFSEAFPADENKVTFKYDDQETVYKGVDSICRLAITYLDRSDYNTAFSRLSKADFSYNGNVTLWKKFVYGLLARNFHRVTNKSIYKADSVIKYCDLAMSTVTEDFVVPFDALKNDDANFYGVFRDNLTLLRQTDYIVNLLDGTILAGSKAAANRDPRIRHMLSMCADTAGTLNGGYKGVVIGVADPLYSGTGANRKAVPTPFGDSIYTITAGSFSGNGGKFLFNNKAVLPVMTSSEIQFMKAEAALINGKKDDAHAAYLKGINLHFDFINRSSWPRNNNVIYNTTAISAAERAAYMSGANVKTDPSTITFSDIMLQKYIALWGWGFFETWVDMRRYHYTDFDLLQSGGATPVQVYKNLLLPATIASTNGGRPAYRVRPRFNSEYVWNADELKRLGAMNSNYHTYECWFSLP